MSACPDLTQYMEHFRKRVVQDALSEATATYWNTRAKQFEAALDQPGDFTGHATEQVLGERRQRITEIVRACRNRAAVSLLGGDL